MTQAFTPPASMTSILTEAGTLLPTGQKPPKLPALLVDIQISG